MMSARVRVLVEKEWAELIHRRALILMTLLIPLLFLFLAFGIAVVLPELMGQSAYRDPGLDPILSALQRQTPGLANLDIKQLFQLVMLRQFMLFLLIVPVMGGITIATYSIVGEKVNRSLEPLLATPLSRSELLWGKCLAAAIPAIAVSWVFFGLYVLGIAVLTAPEVFARVVNATALCIIFLIGPLIGVLGLSLGIITSSRSTDPRSAQQIAVIVILPIVALFISQIRGLFLLTPQIVLVGAVILAVIDYIILKVGAALFERETILTRWK